MMAYISALFRLKKGAILILVFLVGMYAFETSRKTLKYECEYIDR